MTLKNVTAASLIFAWVMAIGSLPALIFDHDPMRFLVVLAVSNLIATTLSVLNYLARGSEIVNVNRFVVERPAPKKREAV